MTARTRSRDLRVTNSGTYWSSLGPTTVTRSALHGAWDDSEDHVGNWEVVNPLSLSHREQFYPTLGGTRVSPTTGAKLREFTAFPIGYKPGPTDPRVKYPTWSPLDMSDLAWEILAGTNPSEAHVNLPSFVGELKDLPFLISGWADVIMSPKLAEKFQKRVSYRDRFPGIGPWFEALQPVHKRAASGNLLMQWVLRPMVSDLLKMWRFTDAVDQRLKWLFDLREGKTLRRRKLLSQRSETVGPTNVVLHSEGTIINGTRSVLYTEKVWGTAHWKVLPAVVHPGYESRHKGLSIKKALMRRHLNQLGYNSLLQKAWDGATGTTAHGLLATAWELTPWSWFIDWFSNVGDIISATNNLFGLTWSNLALMRQTSSRSSYTVTMPLADSWVTFDKNAFHYESWARKERYPVVPFNPFPLPSLPFINGRKWSILASLAILGALRP